MKTIAKETLLGMSIYDLGKIYKWTSPTRHNMERVYTNYSTSIYCQDGADPDSLEKKITLRDLLLSLEKMYFVYTNNYFTSYVSKRHYGDFWSILKKIRQTGLNRIDSVVLPQNTITLKDLQELPRETLLKLDARLLGTISEKMAGVYCYKNQEPDFAIPATIEDVLNCRDKKFFLTKKAKEKTRLVLVQLGFKYQDGFFMQWLDNRRALIDDLIKNDEITEEIAKKIAEIAERRNWVRF